jgi:hypothetical protein
MKERSVRIFFTLGLVAVFLMVAATGAEAGCKKLQPRGPVICASWITGSSVCELLLKGLKGNIAESAYIECAIFGTYFDNPPSDVVPFEEQCDPSSDFFNPSLTCLLTGRAACYNPTGKYNEFGTAFNLPGPLVEVAEQATCDKGGKCTTSAEVDVEGNGGVCNRNWDLTFTAERFFGQICVCPGNFDRFGDCCLDDKRTGGRCKTYYNVGEDEGKPDCLVEFCEYNGDFSQYVFGQDIPGSYSCYETNPDEG